MLKKIIAILIMINLITIFSLKARAYVGNGFIWNKTELNIPVNSNFDDYIEQIEAKFYYKGQMTNEEVKVSLDTFYYGNLSIPTDTCCKKIVKMIATVKGYSTFERRDILVNIVDNECPLITKIKELNFDLYSKPDFSKYISFSDNYKVAYSYVDDKKVNYKVKGTYEIDAYAEDESGNYSKKTYNCQVLDTTKPSVITDAIIEVEYGDETFDIKDHIKVEDNFDSDISKNITCVGLDVYKLGKQEVTIIVSDSSNNVTKIKKEIEVIDSILPVLELTRYDITLDINDTKPDFKSYIKNVSDNCCEVSKDDVIIDESDFDLSLGLKKIIYKLKDKNNNTIKKILNVEITYKSLPVIKCNDLTFNVGQTFNIRDYVEVYDDYDTNIKDKLEIYDDNININKSGTYEVILSVSNFKGNASTKTIYVTLNDSKKNNRTIYSMVEKNKAIICIILGAVCGVLIYLRKKKNKVTQ